MKLYNLSYSDSTWIIQVSFPEFESPKNPGIQPSNIGITNLKMIFVIKWHYLGSRVNFYNVMLNQMQSKCSKLIIWTRSLNHQDRCVANRVFYELLTSKSFNQKCFGKVVFILGVNILNSSNSKKFDGCLKNEFKLFLKMYKIVQKWSYEIWNCEIGLNNAWI